MSASTAKAPRSRVDAPLIGLAYIVTLCTTPAQFYAYLRKIKMPAGEHPEYLGGDDTDTDAVVHFLRSPSKKRHAVVCVSDQAGEPWTKIMALLVHEAVHIWQWQCDFMGEDVPSKEFEAYSIQAISLLLMEEYARGVRAA